MNAPWRRGARYTITPFDLLTAAALSCLPRPRWMLPCSRLAWAGVGTPRVRPIRRRCHYGHWARSTRILGDTLEAIAGEKAAVIKPGRLVVLGEGTHEASVQRVMDARCRECGVVPLVVSHVTTKVPAHVGDTVEFSCTTPRAIYTSSMVKPAYQPQNAACAIMLCEGYLGRELDHESLMLPYGLPHAGSL
ncbi:MAG: hypothetical protein ACLTYW_00835 [Collinsella sp.]